MTLKQYLSITPGNLVYHLLIPELGYQHEYYDNLDAAIEAFRHYVSNRYKVSMNAEILYHDFLREETDETD